MNLYCSWMRMVRSRDKKRILLILLRFMYLPMLLAQVPTMYFSDPDIPGRPFAKDPTVIYFKNTYWMYYSVPDAASKVWHIGIATSNDLIHWQKIGNISGITGTVEEKGICAPGALLKDGRLHLFYQTYGNGRLDAICHAWSDNGTDFKRDPTNPIFNPKISDWSCGRAIDAEVIYYRHQYFLFYATRDTSFKIQQLGLALAPKNAQLDKNSWTEVDGMPLLKPELPWEKSCIEDASCIKKGKYLYLFYAGAYNNEPQQIGVARSKNGVVWSRISSEPFLKNGAIGTWNESESGHPCIFKAANNKFYLFYQGNNDRGKTWYLSNREIGWNKKGPYLK